MLHILLVIFKIIGIILAVMLGILVLLICIVLLVPVRYSLEAECEHFPDGLSVSLKVTWLLHLIRVFAKYENKETTVHIKAAWKEIGEKETEKKEENEKNEERSKKQPEEKKTMEKKSVEKKPVEKKPVDKVEKKEKMEKELPAGVEKKQQKSSESHEEEPAGSTKADKGLGKAVEKLKCTFQAFCGKIKALAEKKDKLSAFIKNEAHQKAFSKVKKEVVKLLRRLMPKKLAAKVQYGFDDPCLTGQVLAVFGVLYPFLGPYVQITPDFDQKILEGYLKAKGNIYGIHLVILLWNLLWSREVRTAYRDIKNFKL